MSDETEANFNSDKFTWTAADVVMPQCSLCVHLDPQSPVAVCAAFPGAVPAEILQNQVDHRKPWIDPDTGVAGDMGVPLERSITFEPREGITPVALDRLYRHLDSL